MLRFDIITIFPEFFRETFDYGIIRRARAAGLVEIEAHDLRGWTTDKHHVVDDRPFGGGDGMVLKPEPIFAAVEQFAGSTRREDYDAQTRVILLSPQGRVLTHSLVDDLSKNAKHIVLICGRYEGVDERVAEALVTDEVSIGDYILSAVHAPSGIPRDARAGCPVERQSRRDRSLAPRSCARQNAPQAARSAEMIFDFRFAILDLDSLDLRSQI